MGNADTVLRRLGRRVADEQDADLDQRGPDILGRERLLASLPVRPRGARIPRVGKAVAAAAALAVAAGALFLVTRRQPLSFRVGSGEDAAVGAPGAFLTAPAGQPVAVEFSDGTSLRLAPESTIRVASVDADGSRVVLESGAMEARVVHREGARWLVDSGPFEVRVTGTRFTVSWDHATERFVLALEEGSVSVSGPVVGEGLSVRAGDTLRVLRREDRFELVRGASEAALTAPSKSAEPAPEDGQGGAGPPPDPGVPPPKRTARAPSVPAPSFRELAQAGRYAEALAAAEREGIQGILDRGSAADLRDLGDAARLAGKAGRAVEVLTTLRRRFASSEEAGQAAFLLGIIAFDMRGAHGESARWFATYLTERPSGPLAREAAGRLIEAYERSGDRPQARAAAQSYLRSYPAGPHAALARAVAAP